MNVRYLPTGGRLSKPESGRVLVHNQVKPQTVIGLNGFRAWTQRKDKTLEVCSCDWAGVKLPLKAHYRVKQRQRRID